MGSPADKALSEDVVKHCNKLGLQTVTRVMSAHKVTQQTLDTVAYVSPKRMKGLHLFHSPAFPQNS